MSQTAGWVAYGQSEKMVFYLGESGAGAIRPLLQSTHDAALDVVGLADLKRRALELS